MGDKEARIGLKLVLGLFVYSLTSVIVLAALGFWWAAHEFQKPGTLKEPAALIVPSGTGFNGIAELLLYHGIIEDTTDFFVFRAMGRLTGQATRLKAGEYEIPAHASMKDIMTQLLEGKTVQRRFTIREGLTSYEIVQHLKTLEGLSGEIATIPPEGALLPNTYDYQLNEPRGDILKRLEEEMITELTVVCGVEAQIRGFDDLLTLDCPGVSAPLKTVGDVLTLASIVEKETGVNEERRRVAGVFINRLKKGIPLQTDPTVIYALTKGQHKNDGKGPLGRRLLKKDLQIDSPYNTYKYAGLPPSPIANPGKASIEAVLNPEEHDYIYFVADGTGGHVFAKTLKKHNANVVRWRKIRRQKQ